MADRTGSACPRTYPAAPRYAIEIAAPDLVGPGLDAFVERLIAATNHETHDNQ